MLIKRILSFLLAGFACVLVVNPMSANANFIEPPDISVTKYASTNLLIGPGEVDYFYSVANIGEEDFTNVQLYDDQYSDTVALFDIGTLEAGDSWSDSWEVFLTVTTTNTAHVSALDSFGQQVDIYDSETVTVEPIPEPTTMFLLGTGLVGGAGAARRKKKYQA